MLTITILVSIICTLILISSISTYDILLGQEHILKRKSHTKLNLVISFSVLAVGLSLIIGLIIQ